MTAADAHGGADEVGARSRPRRARSGSSRIPLLTGAVAAVATVVIRLIEVRSAPRRHAGSDRRAGRARRPRRRELRAAIRDRRIDAAPARGIPGWDIWSGYNACGSPCLVAIAPDEQCGPSGVHPAAGEARRRYLPVRASRRGDDPLRLDGDRCDAWVFPAAEADRWTSPAPPASRRSCATAGRAYGPDPDILDDPAAIEAAVRARVRPLAERTIGAGRGAGAGTRRGSHARQQCSPTTSRPEHRPRSGAAARWQRRVPIARLASLWRRMTATRIPPHLGDRRSAAIVS